MPGTDEQVEQDLRLSRATVELYCDAVAQKNAAFRGGKALHKGLAEPCVLHIAGRHAYALPVRADSLIAGTAATLVAATVVSALHKLKARV